LRAHVLSSFNRWVSESHTDVDVRFIAS
jgi:hypothetical protein